MSLIALTVNNNEGYPVNPFLISDILTSSKRKRNTTLPTFFDGVDDTLGEDSKRYPFGLIQKIYVLQNQIAIGLAGNVNAMSNLLKEVKEYFDLRVQFSDKDYTPSQDDIDNLVQSRLRIPKYNDCLYCFIYISSLYEGGAQINYYLSEGWTSKQTKRFGDVMACASGAENFFNLVDQYQYHQFEVTGGNFSRFMQLISTHSLTFSQLMWLEMANIETLKDFWGGNFEMIYWAERKFQKHKGISSLTILMLFDVETNDVNFEPLIYFENEYIDDLLMIHAIDFKKNQIRRFCVEPIYRDISEEERYLIGYRDNFYADTLYLNCIFNFVDGRQYILHYGATKQKWDEAGIETKFEFEMKDGVSKINIGSFHMNKIIRGGLIGAGVIKE